MTNAQIERLVKLSEEASDVIHAAMKVIHHGYDNSYDNGETNEAALERELANLLCIVDLLLRHDLNPARVARLQDEHLPKLLRFTYFQEGSSLDRDRLVP